MLIELCLKKFYNIWAWIILSMNGHNVIKAAYIVSISTDRCSCYEHRAYNEIMVVWFTKRINTRNKHLFLQIVG